MAAVRIVPVGWPRPLREAIAAVLEPGVGSLAEAAADLPPADPDHPPVVVVYCDTPDRWAVVGAGAPEGSAMVAVLVDLSVDEYARALALGADGVVHHDSPSTTIASVILQAAEGRVSVPAVVAQTLAASWVGAPLPCALGDYDIRLLRALSTGARLAEIAAEFSYSERSLRRHLQALYLKIGARNRNDAVCIAARTRVAAPR